jgi:crotonobetainyl-CoA:carnitine CoA-transferase CaiB-like acyl-CoA transferase
VSTDAPTAGPLSHVKVLDLTVARAGPTAVRQLADLGADVVQVMRPGSEAGAAERVNSDRENLHRNKRSAIIDLQRDEGREVFYRLVPRFDVVVENFRPDVKHRLRIDYDTLSGLHPGLIYASISGFGQDGPYGSRGGLDQVAQGLGGLMSVTGPPGGGPWRVGIPISDLCAGIFLAQGILAALLDRERTGRGRWVHTSLLEAMIAMLDFQATRWLIDGEVPPQAGNDHPTSFPMGVFATKDGHINIGASGGRLYDRFMEAIGGQEIAADPRFADLRSRNAHREELRAACEAKLRERTTAEWVEVLNAAGVPSGPVLSIDQTFADPQVQHLDMARTVQHPIHGELRIVRSPVNLSRTPASVRRAAPLPGADTAAVLLEHSFTEPEVATLVEAGIVGARSEPVAAGRGDPLFG